MELNQIQETEQRVRTYWFEDGWAELVGGVVLMLLGLFFAGQGLLPSGSLGQSLFSSGLVLVLVVGGLATRWAINAMKTRFTYPRTGYVSYRVDKAHARRRQLIAGGAGAVMAAMLVIAAVQVGSTAWVPAISGLLVGCILVYMKARLSGLRRFYALAAFAAVLGVLLSFGTVTLEFRLALFYGLLGLVFVASGVLQLRHYLHENPLPPEEPGSER